MQIGLIIGRESIKIFGNEVYPHGLFLRRQDARDKRQLIWPAGNIAGLLGDNEVYFSRKAVLKEAAPFRRTLHTGSGNAGVNVEIYQLPVGA